VCGLFRKFFALKGLWGYLVEETRLAENGVHVIAHRNPQLSDVAQLSLSEFGQTQEEPKEGLTQYSGPELVLLEVMIG